MDRYDINSLIECNYIYHLEHGVTQADVDMVNERIEHIESTRSTDCPKEGDRIRITTKYGDYYAHGHIHSLYESRLEIIEKPFVPYIWVRSDGIRCDPAGGGKYCINLENVIYLGKEKKLFKDWGHNGICGGGAVTFQAEVNVWEYKYPEPLYGDFTTQFWRRIYVYSRKQYVQRVQGDAMAWDNESEYREFVRHFKGTEFETPDGCANVLWCYREEVLPVSISELSKLDLPVTSIYLNGKRKAKYKYDDKNKVVIHYSNWDHDPHENSKLMVGTHF